MPGDLFDDVDLLGAVGTPRGDRHGPHVATAPVTVNPIGSSNGARSSAPSDVPRIRLTALTRTAHERSAGGSDPLRPSTAPAWTTRSGHVSASSSTKRAIAVSMPNGSTPRSNRIDASERRPRRATLWLIGSAANHAISNATVVVASLISVSAPPMIPASPIGRSSASQIRRSSAASRRSTPSSVVERLAVDGAPDAEAVRRRASPGRRRGSAGRSPASRSCSRRRRC